MRAFFHVALKRITALLLLLSCLWLQAEIILVSPIQGSQVALHSEGQLEYLQKPQAERRKMFANSVYRITMRNLGDEPKPVVFVWKATGKSVAPFTLLLSETPDFKSAQQYQVNELTYSATNLKIATNYYWKVTAANGDGAQGSFKTADQAPRLIQVDGVPNVRDLGGRIGLDGRRVRQGMVYRSAGLNNNASPIYEKVKPEDRIKKMSPGRLQMYQLAEQNLKDGLVLGKEPLLPWMLKEEWMVYRLTKERLTEEGGMAIAALTEMPKELHGVKPVAMKASPDGELKMEVSKYRIYELAVLMQEVESSVEGQTVAAFGADWFWLVAVNGKVIYNRFFGNTVNPIPRDNYSVVVPLRKGKNLITAVVGSGSGGFNFWCHKPVQPYTAATLAQGYRQMNKEIVKQCLQPRAIGRQPGKSRVEGASGDYMRNVLGIRSDIDLRSDSECYGMKGSPLGPSVTWFHYSSSSYKGMAYSGGKQAFGKVFRVFLDPKNYPIDFHCIAGQDRTGAVAFILNAILGVKEDELYLDWEATGFWNPNVRFRHDTLFDHLVEVFQPLEGKDICEKAVTYVKSCGFTDADIARFREIMLEK